MKTGIMLVLQMTSLNITLPTLFVTPSLQGVSLDESLMFGNLDSSYEMPPLSA